ncbi:MAG: putative Ig domain-containing protein [Steroidobacteraceae bacterium]
MESCNSWVVVAMLGCLVATTGCKGGGGSGAPSQAASTSSTAPPLAAPNQTPTISGSPGSTIVAGQKYTFVPVAADADGDTLGFSIANRPTWAQFDTATGRLSGTPTVSNTGSFAGILISVSDGKSTTALPTFALNVTPAAAPSSGAATLSWAAPTVNVDGSALTNLAGYRIRYGTKANQLTQEITINNAGLTTYMVTDLTPATYYFAIQAVNSAGAESALSSIASKTIS